MEDIQISIRRSIKNKVLLDLMKQNNIPSYAKLSELIGIKAYSLHRIITLKCNDKNPHVIKLAKFFNVTPDYIISDSMSETGRRFHRIQNKIEKEIDSFQFIQLQSNEALMLEAPDTLEFVEQDECKETIERCMNECLTPREKMVLEMRFGLNDGETKTLQEVARTYSVSRDRVRQIEHKALKKLRHPKYERVLKEFVKESNRKDRK